MRNFLKQLIKFGAVALICTGAVGFWPGLLAGYLAYKAVDVVAGLVKVVRDARMSAKANVSDEEKKRLVKMHKENTRKQFYNVNGKCWNLRDLPFDFSPSAAASGREAYFTVAGVQNVVKGKVLDRRGRKVAFSIEFDSADKAQKMSEYIEENGLLGAKVSRTDDGKFCITSDNAVDMGHIVKQFYPPHTFRVEREISTTRQFIVSGCKSYEEALEKFNRDRAHYSPANIYQTVQDTVEGHKAPEQSSSNILNPSTLEAGSFIINATDTEVFSKNVTFYGGIDCTDDALRSEASAAYTMEGMSRDNDLVEDKCSKTPVFSNGIDEDKVVRYVKADGESMVLRTLDDTDVSLTGAHVVMRFKNREDLMAYVSGDVPTAGMSVFIDTGKPVMNDGEYVLTLPLTNELVESMNAVDGRAGKMHAEYAAAGLTRQDCECACILDDICGKGGYTTVKLADNLDFSKGYVNGVPVGEFQERTQVDDRKKGFLDTLDEQHQQQWLKDAACIESVHLNLDLKTNELVTTFTIATEQMRNMKVERTKLTEEETLAMQRRGDISKAEMKDLLIKMHPDLFKTYSVDGKSVFYDPVKAFIRNERPQFGSSSKEHQKKTVQKVTQSEKKAAKKNKAMNI